MLTTLPENTLYVQEFSFSGNCIAFSKQMSPAFYNIYQVFCETASTNISRYSIQMKKPWPIMYVIRINFNLDIPFYAHWVSVPDHKAIMQWQFAGPVEDVILYDGGLMKKLVDKQVLSRYNSELVTVLVKWNLDFTVYCSIHYLIIWQIWSFNTLKLVFFFIIFVSLKMFDLTI